MAEALAFPASAQPAWLETSGLSQCGLGLKVAGASDLPFLRDLYAESRAAELACVPWPPAARRAFCDSQFTLQHRHYVAHCVPAVFLIVLAHDQPVGRIYLHWTSEDLHIVDVLLGIATRGRGIGSALLRWAQAITSGAAVDTLSLHVEQSNQGAYRLYSRLGFREEQSSHPAHRRMVWRPPAGFATLVS
jgi:ribosomal protein S18 acetylase RimI-like enzyme